MREVDSRIIGDLTGFSDMGFTFSPSTKTTRGIICCWNSSLFIASDTFCNPRFVVAKGHCSSCEGPVGIICVYAPNNLPDRIECFNFIVSFIHEWECSDYIICGDLNVVL